MPVDDQPLAPQEAQRLADGRATHLQRLGELGIDQALARLELAEVDRLAQLLVNVLGDALGLDRHEDIRDWHRRDLAARLSDCQHSD